MGILATVASAVQRLFGEIAQEVADECGVIRRQRKFTGPSLARTFVLGFLQHPRASDEQLAQVAGHLGVAVTPQAIDQRHTPQLAEFLRRLFTRATQVAVGSEKVLAPLLRRFTRVIVLDSSTIRLPDAVADEF